MLCWPGPRLEVGPEDPLSSQGTAGCWLPSLPSHPSWGTRHPTAVPGEKAGPGLIQGRMGIRLSLGEQGTVDPGWGLGGCQSIRNQRAPSGIDTRQSQVSVCTLTACVLLGVVCAFSWAFAYLPP